MIEIDKIQPWTERFARDGICLLLEPLDPLRNGYNLSCLIDESTTLIEIAGPGFDASDLQRGHIRPHEIRTFDHASGRFGSPSIIDHSAYKTSVAERKRKIWWKLHKRELVASRWRPLSGAQQEACDELILRARGSNLPTTYEPVPKAILDRYGEVAQPIIEAWRRQRREFPAVLAGSFVEDNSFCFWDVNTSKRWLNTPV